MRNRAKCKLCQVVIESTDEHDVCQCECGEISVLGGSKEFRCAAKDFSNFIRVDDDDKEIEVRVKNKTQEEEFPQTQPSKKEMIEMLYNMIKNYQDLPQQAMSTYINHYDLLSVLMLVYRIFESERESDNL